ncbi:BsuBI/PstI family type II restriction endonuclease [uncultured Desulfosarcina sp.]|uniref:BsuBI/PstI family type II restriction endonuclease n=1 Tax=uncultured Desulfosarcina sp. TaxID=218289 RepID=UPI0029C926C4|nr:BsuBI/PstI family type II restriction endonuclease [uncultured Desulfosarcina sp.]
MTFPPILPVAQIHERLQMIFPEGTPHRHNCVWEIAAKTVFVMIYVGAVESEDVWIRPDQITRMTDDQADVTDEGNRMLWRKESLRPSRKEIPGRWYAVNTREPIRDDTLRGGLISNGAVIERTGLPTTSPAPRYALRESFVALFNPNLKNGALLKAIEEWQVKNLTAGALARVTILRKAVVAAAEEGVMVTFPNGETRRMAAGPSSVISKSVIEDFAHRYLIEPGVIFLSESANKIVARDDELARGLGLNIESDRNLPDIILVDLGPPEPLLVFIEVVATDGPVNQKRKDTLLHLAEEAGFLSSHIAFVTAYMDRSEAAFKKTVNDLAWGSFAWFVAEPDKIMVLRTEKMEGNKLVQLL